jgi:hypothetical protein
MAAGAFITRMSLFHGSDGAVTLMFAKDKWTRNEQGTTMCGGGGTAPVGQQPPVGPMCLSARLRADNHCHSTYFNASADRRWAVRPVVKSTTLDLEIEAIGL